MENEIAVEQWFVARRKRGFKFLRTCILIKSTDYLVWDFCTGYSIVKNNVAFYQH